MNAEPEWVPVFLSLLPKMDVRRAAQLAGVSRTRVYVYRCTAKGCRLREEWARILSDDSRSLVRRCRR